MATDAHPDGHVLNRVALIEIHRQSLVQIEFDTGPQEKLAFWRACKEDIAAAAQRLRETSEWRRSSGIDRIMTDFAWLEKERAIRHVLKYDYLGPDQHGRPVMVERVGDWCIDSLLAAIAKPDEFLILHCMACETLHRMARPPGTLDCRGQVLIMDCLGLGLRHLRPGLTKAFGAITVIDASHYPDTVAHIFVVNAPRLFSAVVAMIRPFLDTDTLSKFTVSQGVPQEMIALLGPACLPVELGGSRRNIFPYSLSAPVSAHPHSLEHAEGGDGAGEHVEGG